MCMLLCHLHDWLLLPRTYSAKSDTRKPKERREKGLWESGPDSPTCESGLSISLRVRVRIPTHTSLIDWAVGVTLVPTSVAMAEVGFKEDWEVFKGQEVLPLSEWMGFQIHPNGIPTIRQWEEFLVPPQEAV